MQEAVPLASAASSGGSPDSQAVHTSSGGPSQEGQATAAAARGSHGAANGTDAADKEGGNLVHNNKGMIMNFGTS